MSSGPLWYPYTPLADAATHPPLKVTRAEGLYVFDEQGRAILDGISSWWCCLHGHRHPHLMEAMRRQMEDCVHVALAGLTHDPVERLAERLTAMAPGSDHRVFFSDNGSTSIEVAIKICLQRWRLLGQDRRRLLVGFDGGYHGDTIGCMAVGGSETFHRWFEPWFPESLRLPSPSDSKACLEALEDLIERQGDEVACVVIEPLLQAAGGMLVHSPETLRGIADRCSDAGIPLIVDEIATGFGRTGSLWAVDQAGVVPDILCVSKALTGGMLPLSATIVREELSEVFVDRDDEVDRTFYHGHTYTGHALACAVAHASLDLIEDPSFLPHVGNLCEAVEAGLEKFRDAGLGVTTRQVGTVGIVQTGLPGSRPLLPLYHDLLARGLYLRPLGDLMYFWTPLTISREQLTDVMDLALESLCRSRSVRAGA